MSSVYSSNKAHIPPTSARGGAESDVKSAQGSPFVKPGGLKALQRASSPNVLGRGQKNCKPPSPYVPKKESTDRGAMTREGISYLKALKNTPPTTPGNSPVFSMKHVDVRGKNPLEAFVRTAPVPRKNPVNNAPNKDKVPAVSSREETVGDIPSSFARKVQEGLTFSDVVKGKTPPQSPHTERKALTPLMALSPRLSGFSVADRGRQSARAQLIPKALPLPNKRSPLTPQDRRRAERLTKRYRPQSGQYAPVKTDNDLCPVLEENVPPPSFIPQPPPKEARLLRTPEKIKIHGKSMGSSPEKKERKSTDSSGKKTDMPLLSLDNLSTGEGQASSASLGDIPSRRGSLLSAFRGNQLSRLSGSSQGKKMGSRDSLETLSSFSLESPKPGDTPKRQSSRRKSRAQGLQRLFSGGQEDHLKQGFDDLKQIFQNNPIYKRYQGVVGYPKEEEKKEEKSEIKVRQATEKFQNDMLVLYVALTYGTEEEKKMAQWLQHHRFGAPLTSIDGMVEAFTPFVTHKFSGNPSPVELFFTVYPMTEGIKEQLLRCEFYQPKNTPGAPVSLAHSLSPSKEMIPTPKKSPSRSSKKNSPKETDTGSQGPLSFADAFEKVKKEEGFTRASPLKSSSVEVAAYGFAKDILPYHAKQLGFFKKIETVLNGEDEPHEEEWSKLSWKERVEESVRAFLGAVPALVEKDKSGHVSLSEIDFLGFCKNYFPVKETTDPSNMKDPFIEKKLAYPAMSMGHGYAHDIDRIYEHEEISKIQASLTSVFAQLLRQEDITRFVTALKELHKDEWAREKKKPHTPTSSKEESLKEDEKA